MGCIWDQDLIQPISQNYMGIECYKNVKNAKANSSEISEQGKQAKFLIIKLPENAKNAVILSMIQLSISDKIYLSTN